MRHALRSLVKQGDPGALAVLGFGARPALEVRNVRILPRSVQEGDSVTLSFDLVGTGPRLQRIVADFRVHYVKANGSAHPKVFKLKSPELRPGETISLSLRASVRPESLVLFLEGHAPAWPGRARCPRSRDINRSSRRWPPTC